MAVEITEYERQDRPVLQLHGGPSQLGARRSESPTRGQRKRLRPSSRGPRWPKGFTSGRVVRARQSSNRVFGDGPTRVQPLGET
ncbi:hypothetical protein VTN49DRAFT_2049 [Thermomyces lanuginosus]|uniref:uncharacterized protein n=1 Tax=Thermomyces lanuginosus TaxID=5541 RepID=UPI003742F759